MVTFALRKVGLDYDDGGLGVKSLICSNEATNLKSEETSFHLFFECAYSCNIWCWMSSMLNFPLHFQFIEEIWKTSDIYSNQQNKLVVNSAIINIMNAIWFARNQIRLNNKRILWKSSITYIIAITSLACTI